MLLLSFPYRHRPHRHQTPSRLALKRDGPGTLQISKTINMFNKRSSFRRVAPFKEFGFRNPGNFCLRNPESCALESGILKAQGIRNPIEEYISTDNDRNQVPGIQNLRCGIQNPRLSWIPLHGARKKFKSQIPM